MPSAFSLRASELNEGRLNMPFLLSLIQCPADSQQRTKIDPRNVVLCPIPPEKNTADDGVHEPLGALVAADAPEERLP